MDQAVRAPAIMQELISPAPTPAAAPRYQPATIREIIEEEETHARPVIEMSDDEMPEDVPVSNSADSVDSVEAMMEVSGESEEAETRRGRRKKVPVDLTFSSGTRTDGRSSCSYSLFLQEESRTTRSLNQSQLKNQRKP